MCIRDSLRCIGLRRTAAQRFAPQRKLGPGERNSAVFYRRFCQGCRKDAAGAASRAGGRNAGKRQAESLFQLRDAAAAPFLQKRVFFHDRGHRLLLSAEHTGHLRQAVRLPSAAQDASRTRIVEKYNLLSEKHLDSGGGTRIMKGKGSAPQRLRFCGGKG